MKHLVAIGLIACMALIPQLVKAQAGSYGRSFQKCTLKTPSGVRTNFSCRWMWDGISGGTAFVDNYDTDARYEVGTAPMGWHSTSMIGIDSKACIKSKRGAVVCLVD